MSAVKQFISNNVNIDCISPHVSSMYTCMLMCGSINFDTDWLDSTNEGII